MVEQIIHKDKLLSIIIRNSHTAEGIEFYTPDDFSQQLGYMNRPKGYVIPPHVHNLVLRSVSLTQEVLYIKSGTVRVDFYDDSKEYLESRVLNQGDVILLATGGHGFEMISNAEIIEVKQGPFCGDQDKTRFEPVHHTQLKLNL
jgi:hypothetical protein